MQYRISLWYLLNVPCDWSLFIHQNLIYSAYRRVKRKKKHFIDSCFLLPWPFLKKVLENQVIDISLLFMWKMVTNWPALNTNLKFLSLNHLQALILCDIISLILVYFGSQTRNITLRLWSFLHGDRLMVFVKANNEYSSHFATTAFFFF